jgi:hypothetical protein
MFWRNDILKWLPQYFWGLSHFSKPNFFLF